MRKVSLWIVLDYILAGKTQEMPPPNKENESDAQERLFSAGLSLATLIGT
jgi:hypothetical protein